MKILSPRTARLPFLLRIGTFFGVLLAMWLPFAGLMTWLISDANTVTILTMSVMFIEFLVLVRLWGWRLYRNAHPFHTYGLEWTPQNGWELIQGLGIGLVAIFGMFIVQGAFGWLQWRSPDPNFGLVLAEGLLVGLGVGLAEELLFRGWLLDELQRDYRASTVLWINTTVFAVLHFLRPWSEVVRLFPQFGGLLLLGGALVLAKRATLRLGLPMGIHAGLVLGNYLINVGDLVTYNNRVPQWITGIDENPMAGVVGLLFLAGLVGLMVGRSRRSALHPNQR